MSSELVRSRIAETVYYCWNYDSNSRWGWCTTTTKQTLCYCNNSRQTLASKYNCLASSIVMLVLGSTCWVVTHIHMHTHTHSAHTHACVHVGSPMKMLCQMWFSLVNLKNRIFKTAPQSETYNMIKTFFTFFAISQH